MSRLAALVPYALLLAACGEGAGTHERAAPSAAATASPDAIDTTLEAIYRRYQTDIGSDPAKADWDFPIWSADLTALIDQWEKGFSPDEVAELQDFGWLCECQDWDPAKFTVEVLPHPSPANGRVEATVRFDSDGSEPRDMRFDLVDEGGKWMIDDLHAASFDVGLRASLRRGIADAARSKP
jgi:hypothetical protein